MYKVKYRTDWAFFVSLAVLQVSTTESKIEREIRVFTEEEGGVVTLVQGAHRPDVFSNGCNRNVPF